MFSAAVLQPALFCMQFANYAGNIAVGTLIQKNTLPFCIFWIFPLFSERSWKVKDWFMIHVTGTWKHFSYIIWKGYFHPFVSALKCIKFLLAVCKRGLDIACKIEKIAENKTGLYCIACGNWLIHDSCNRYMQTLQLHYLKGLLSPFFSALKCIKFLLAVCKRGLDIACKIEKISENKTGLYCITCGNKTLHAACNRVACRAMQKVIKYSLKQLAWGIH